MPHRFAVSLGVVAVADAIAWILAIHATLDYRRGLDGPTVMSLGDLLGWIIAVALLAVAVIMAGSRLRRLRETRRTDRWLREGGR